jgi:hypothetical protein
VSVKMHDPIVCDVKIEFLDVTVRAPVYWTEFESVADLMSASVPARYLREDPKGEPKIVKRWTKGYRGRGTYIYDTVIGPAPTMEEWLAKELDQVSTHLFGTYRTLRETNRALLDGRAHAACMELYESLRESVDREFLPGEEAISTRRRRAWNDQDGTPDADRVNERQERFMIDSRRGRPMRIVRLGVNIAQNFDQGESPYVKLAAECAAAAEHLQRLGYSVQIIGLCAVHHFGRVTCHTWPLKLSHEPLDIGRVLSMSALGLHRWHIRDGLRQPGNGCLTSPEVKQRIGIDYMFGESDRDWSGAWATISALLNDGEPVAVSGADASMDEAMEAAQKKPATPIVDEPDEEGEDEAFTPTDDPAEADAQIEKAGTDDQDEDRAATGEAAESPEDATSEDATEAATQDDAEAADASEGEQEASEPEGEEGDGDELEPDAEGDIETDEAGEDEGAEGDEETGEEPTEDPGETPSEETGDEPADEGEADESDEPGELEGDSQDEQAEDDEQADDGEPSGEEDQDAEEEGPVDEAAEPKPQPMELIDARELMQIELDETLASIKLAREQGEDERAAKLERKARAWEAALGKIK